MKKKKMRVSLRLWIVLLFAASLVFSTLYPARIYANGVFPEDEKAFKEALEDTKNTTQSEIVRELLAVVPRPDWTNYKLLHGDEIIWENPAQPESSRVLVVAFMTSEDYKKYYEEGMGKTSYQLQKSLWVTILPEMRNHFVGNECPPTKKRIMQLLGLHPTWNVNNNVLLEMWVDPKVLFRPSPDPEITDHESELATRISDSDYWIYPTELNPFLCIDPYVYFRDSLYSIPETFKEWYDYRAKTIYNTEGDISTWGYPWTRLGYSYDWGDSDNHVGLSEFIIRIDPYAGYVKVKLEKAINFDENPDQWAANFRCGPADSMLSKTTSGTEVSLSWTNASGAEGYFLMYKAAVRGKPFEPPFEDSIDLGNTNHIDISLPSGACFHAAVQGYDARGAGAISNIVYIYIP